MVRGERGSGSESSCSIGESVIERRKRLGVPENRFCEDSEEEDRYRDDSSSSSYAPLRKEKRPRIGAPRDFLANKEEEEEEDNIDTNQL
eukprot:5916489-Karenia_brevis.AAC.1